MRDERVVEVARVPETEVAGYALEGSMRVLEHVRRTGTTGAQCEIRKAKSGDLVEVLVEAASGHVTDPRRVGGGHTPVR